LIGVALAGCETSGDTHSSLDVKTLPEYQKHQECLGRQTAIYSTAAGSPLELGIITSSACNSTRYALRDAIAKVKGRAYAQGYTGASEKEEPKMIAGVIAKVKAGQKPF
jgi:hypothetical protein